MMHIIDMVFDTMLTNKEEYDAHHRYGVWYHVNKPEQSDYHTLGHPPPCEQPLVLHNNVVETLSVMQIGSSQIILWNSLKSKHGQKGSNLA